jgi:hypothetical protein
MPNRMFRNAEGKYFQDVTTSGGFGHLQKGHGVAFGDIDNDGDQDIYMVIGGALPGDAFQNALFENPGHGSGAARPRLRRERGSTELAEVSVERSPRSSPTDDNHWITLKLEGVRSNRAAIGARIKVTVNTKTGSRDIYATVTTGGSFGASSLQQEIGLGQATSIREIEIFWPVSGKVQVFKNVEMDQTLKIREGEPVPISMKLELLDLSPETVHSGHSNSSHRHNHDD